MNVQVRADIPEGHYSSLELALAIEGAFNGKTRPEKFYVYLDGKVIGRFIAGAHRGHGAIR